MASVSGDLFSSLYGLYMAIAIVVGGLVIGWLVVSLVRFRARPGMERPKDAPIAGALPAERGHPAGSYVMAALIALIMFGLAFSTIGAINTIEHPPEDPNSVHVEVTGYQFGWIYQYHGDGGIPVDLNLYGGVDERFVVPEDRPVILNITSSDVWHNFAFSDFRLRVDAIPGTVNKLWFNATEPGEYRQACVQLCGVRHANMWSIVKVVPEPEFRAWLTSASDAQYDARTTSFLKDAKRGTVVNATLDGAGLALSVQNATAGKPVVVNLTNALDEAASVTLGERTYIVPAGATQRLWLEAAPASGTLPISANGRTAGLQVVSR